MPKPQSKAADFLAALLFGGLPPPNPPERREDIMGKDIRIAVRVTAREKEKMQTKARKCGLSTTEYVKQRALGYEPRGIPPDGKGVMYFGCYWVLAYIQKPKSNA